MPTENDVNFVTLNVEPGTGEEEEVWGKGAGGGQGGGDGGDEAEAEAQAEVDVRELADRPIPKKYREKKRRLNNLGAVLSSA